MNENELREVNKTLPTPFTEKEICAMLHHGIIKKAPVLYDTALTLVTIGIPMKADTSFDICFLECIGHSSIENCNLVSCVLNGSSFNFTEPEAKFFLGGYKWLSK